jgi:hypothetical protein
VFVSIQLPARFCPLAHVYSGFDFLVKLMSFLLRLFHSLGRYAPRPIFSCVIFVQSVQSSRRFFVSVFTPASLSTPEHASCLSVKETLLVFDFLLRGKSSAPSSFGSALRARAGPRAGFDFAADNLFFCSRVHVCTGSQLVSLVVVYSERAEFLSPVVPRSSLLFLSSECAGRRSKAKAFSVSEGSSWDSVLRSRTRARLFPGFVLRPCT